MAKLKAARAKSKGVPGAKARGAVPCIILVAGIMAFMMLLFFYALKG
jgi:hypothetical protein